MKRVPLLGATLSKMVKSRKRTKIILGSILDSNLAQTVNDRRCRKPSTSVREFFGITALLKYHLKDSIAMKEKSKGLAFATSVF